MLVAFAVSEAESNSEARQGEELTRRGSRQTQFRRPGRGICGYVERGLRLSEHAHDLVRGDSPYLTYRNSWLPMDCSRRPTIAPQLLGGGFATRTSNKPCGASPFGNLSPAVSGLRPSPSAVVQLSLRRSLAWELRLALHPAPRSFCASLPRSQSLSPFPQFRPPPFPIAAKRVHASTINAGSQCRCRCERSPLAVT